MDTLEIYLTDIQALLLKEKYPTGISQRQRILEIQEAGLDSVDGYSYFDNGELIKLANNNSNNHSNSSESDQSSFSASSPTRSTQRKKVGKRLVLHETDE